MRITDSDGDLVRAAGVLVEFVQGRPIVVDLAHYRELVTGAPSNRTHDDLEAKATAAAKEKRTGRASNIDVAWFLVYGLLGADQDKSPLLQSGERSRASPLAGAAGRQRAAQAARGSGDGGQARARRADARADDRAYGANLDLGNALIHTLTTVDPGDR